MSMTKQDRLEELQAKAYVQRVELYKTNVAINVLMKDMWHESTGINIGDHISYIDFRTEVVAILDSLTIDGVLGIIPNVRNVLKDGSAGNKIKKLWTTKIKKVV